MKGPTMFIRNCLFFLGSEIFLDIKRPTNLLGRLPFNDVGSELTKTIKQRRNLQIVCSQ